MSSNRGLSLNFNSSGISNTIGNIFTTGGNVGIGTTAPANMLSLNGTNNSITGPHVSITTSTDTYPVFQQLNYGHDNISLNFDGYYDGSTFRTSTSNFFQIYKIL